MEGVPKSRSATVPSFKIPKKRSFDASKSSDTKKRVVDGSPAKASRLTPQQPEQDHNEAVDAIDKDSIPMEIHFLIIETNLSSLRQNFVDPANRIKHLDYLRKFCRDLIYICTIKDSQTDAHRLGEYVVIIDAMINYNRTQQNYSQPISETFAPILSRTSPVAELDDRARETNLRALQNKLASVQRQIDALESISPNDLRTRIINQRVKALESDYKDTMGITELDPSDSFKQSLERLTTQLEYIGDRKMEKND